MIDLVEYYKENVAKNECYSNKFSLSNIITQFTMLDEIKAERSSYNRKQKSFLIKYGIMILNFIIMNSNWIGGL